MQEEAPLGWPQPTHAGAPVEAHPLRRPGPGSQERAYSSYAFAWGRGLAVLSILLACAFFTHVYRHAVRTGLSARYSAESVS